MRRTANAETLAKAGATGLVTTRLAISQASTGPVPATMTSAVRSAASAAAPRMPSATSPTRSGGGSATPIGYFVLTTFIYAVGLSVVTGGRAVRARRDRTPEFTG